MKFNTQMEEGGLFANNINAFLKFKQEASGLPKWCVTETNTITDIENYFVKEGIRLNYTNI